MADSPRAGARSRGFGAAAVVMLLFAYGSSASAALKWPLESTAMRQTSDYLHYLLAVGFLRDNRLARPERVYLFYRARDFRPFWVGRDGVELASADLLKALQAASAEGLNPSDYHVEEIAAYLSGGLRDEVELARLDVLLTDAFFGYGLDVRSGRMAPRHADPDWHIEPEPFDVEEALHGALSQGTMRDTLAALPPPAAGYRQLKQALHHYRAIRAKGGWPSVSGGETLRPGMYQPRVQELRSRLQASGEMGESGGDPNLFDASLMKAVMAFQQRHGIEVDGQVGPATLAALNVGVDARIRQIIINMERWRWLPRVYGRRYIMVNSAGFTLSAMEEGRSVLDMRVIVGRDYRQTPSFSSPMESVVVNPYWYVPRTVLRQDFLPALRRDPGHLQRLGIQVFSSLAGQGRRVDPFSVDWHAVDEERFPYVLRQEPGPNNALGRLKFMMPNSYGIYLHDTPNRKLFERTVRTFSSGCIRVEDPVKLAQYALAGQPEGARRSLEGQLAAGRPRQIALREPLPVYLVYWTAWVEADGGVAFRDDIYSRDLGMSEGLWPGRGIGAESMAVTSRK